MPKPLDDEFIPEGSAPVAQPQQAPAGKLRRGWSAGQSVMDSGSNYTQALKLDSNTQIIKFLEDEPYAAFQRHWIRRVSANGNTVNRPYVCLESVGQNCPLCSALGDRPQAVSSFNVALIGDDGVPVLKTWDVGSRIFKAILNFSKDSKFGPLTRGYYAVHKTGTGTQSQTNLLPIKSDAALLDDYSVQPPTPESLSSLGLYDSSAITIPALKELQEIVAEMSDDAY